MKKPKKPNFDNLVNLNEEQENYFDSLVDKIHNCKSFLVNGYGNFYQRQDAKKKLDQAKADMFDLLA